MKDLRQAVIDVIHGLRIMGVSEKERIYNQALQNAEAVVLGLPFAQLDLSEYSDKLWRAAYERGKKEAQTDIVRCKDCKNWDTTWQNDWAKNYHYCPLIDGTRNGDWYCADAERREDDEG